MNQFSVDHPLSPNEDLESFDRAIGTKTRIPDRHGHKNRGLLNKNCGAEGPVAFPAKTQGVRRYL